MVLLCATCFGSLMDIDKFVRLKLTSFSSHCFGSLMDIDKFVHKRRTYHYNARFGSLMDIDKFVRQALCSNTGRRFGSLMDKIKQDLYYTLKAAILGGLFHAFITTNCEN